MDILKWRTESDKGLEAGGMVLDEQGLPAGVLCTCVPSTEKFCKKTTHMQYKDSYGVGGVSWLEKTHPSCLVWGK